MCPQIFLKEHLLCPVITDAEDDKALFDNCPPAMVGQSCNVELHTWTAARFETKMAQLHLADTWHANGEVPNKHGPGVIAPGFLVFEWPRMMSKHTKKHGKLIGFAHMCDDFGFKTRI